MSLHFEVFSVIIRNNTGSQGPIEKSTSPGPWVWTGLDQPNAPTPSVSNSSYRAGAAFFFPSSRHHPPFAALRAAYLSPVLSASAMAQPAFLSSLRSRLRAPSSPYPRLQPSRGYHVELGAREKAVSPPPSPLSPRFGTPITRSCAGLGLLVAVSGLALVRSRFFV